MNPNSLRPRSRRAACGLTALELTVSSAVLVVVLTVSATGILGAQTTARSVSARTESQKKTSAAAERVTALLADCSGNSIAGSIAAPTGASSITFRERTGWNGGSTVLGEVTTIQWEADPADPENGRDDDNDGFVDEGRVTWQSGTGTAAKRAILVQNVASRLEGETAGNARDDNGNGLIDERGLSFVLANGRLTVRMTVMRRDPVEKKVLVETCQSELRIDG